MISGQGMDGLGVEGITGLRLWSETTRDHAVIVSWLEEALVGAGLLPVYAMTRDELRDAMHEHFEVLVGVLLMLAASALALGVLGLATTVSLNVLERRRELGVMRAMGASRRMIASSLLQESMGLCAAGVVASLVLCIPMTWVLVEFVGEHGLHIDVPVKWDMRGVVLWVVLSCMLAGMASFWPARAASRQRAVALLEDRG